MQVSKNMMPVRFVIMETLKKIKFLHWSVPAALFFVVLLSYGIYIPWFGLYGDDWIYLWNYHLLGSDSFSAFVAADRPFSAWIYVIVTSLFGETVWFYHVFILILRWVCSMLLWWILRMFWKDKNRAILWIAMLFAIYPGFGQQPIALQFILHFSVLLLFLFSIGTMLRAVQKPDKRNLYLLLSIASTFNIFSLEYFIGLELLRPVLLWIVIKQQGYRSSKIFNKTAIFLLPYLTITIAFFVWRIFIYKFQFYEPKFLIFISEDPTNAIKTLMVRIITDIKLVTYNAWRQITRVSDIPLPVLITLLLGSFLLIILYFWWFEKKQQSGYINPVHNPGHWAWGCILLGTYSLMIAGWPFWITNIPLEISFPWDRSTLPFMLGSALIIVGLLDLFVRPRYQVLFMAAIISMTFGWHYQNAVIYRDEWNNLRTYFSQLSWRVPALQQGTIIISEDIPLWRYSDNDLTAPLNWMYETGEKSNQMAYRYYDLTTRKESVLPGLEKGLPVNHGYRSLSFESTTDEILNIFYKPPGCLWAMDSEDDHYPDLPTMLRDIMFLSDLDQVIIGEEPMQTMPAVFGRPIEKGWCYYFERADLARQKKDWEEIVLLARTAEENGFTTGFVVETLPFIQGYLYTRDFERAKDLSLTAYEEPALKQQLCKIWGKTTQEIALSSEEIQIVNDFKQSIRCDE